MMCDANSKLFLNTYFREKRSSFQDGILFSQQFEINIPLIKAI